MLYPDPSDNHTSIIINGPNGQSNDKVNVSIQESVDNVLLEGLNEEIYSEDPHVTVPTATETLDVGGVYEEEVEEEIVVDSPDDFEIVAELDGAEPVVMDTTSVKEGNKDCKLNCVCVCLCILRPFHMNAV